LLVLWRIGAFAQLELSISNVYFVPAPTRGEIVLVAMDDASLARYGRSPSEWSRAVYADLVRLLANAGARVVALDLLFSEPTRDDDVLAQALRDARQSDSRTRLVLASAGIQAPFKPTEGAYPRTISYPYALLPVPTLREAVDYVGFVNAFPDVDSRVRRQLSVVQMDEPYLSFSLATYLAYLRVPSAGVGQVVTPTNDGLRVASVNLPTDTNGLWQQNFFGAALSPQRATFPTYPLTDVLDGKVDTGVFANKVVMVGILNSTGAVDQYLVPSSSDGQPMAGVEIQANALETLLQGAPIVSPSREWMSLVLVALALVAGALYGLGGNLWKLSMLALLMALVVGASLGAFSLTRTVYPLFYMSLAVLLPFPLGVLWELNREFRLRVQAQAENRVLEVTNERIATEKRYLELISEKEEAEIAALQSLNSLKTHLIRMASHDLKNPLGRIFGYADLLMMQSLAPNQERFVKNIRKASEEMNAIVTDILNLEQLRSSVPKRERLTLNDLVKEILLRHEGDFEQKLQTFEGDLTEEALTIDADPRQLSQALSNLVGNASKYTPERGHIRVVLAREGDFARFDVQDNGYGIPEDALGKLFTEFYRVKTEETAGISGTGLGLSLVKSVIETHGGRVGVVSKVGEGSTFTVHLPLVTPTPEEAQTPNDGTSSAGSEGTDTA
jgi:signal transduction histidine kinase